MPTIQGGGSRIMTWGCISTFGFHDLTLLKGKVDTEIYIAMLNEFILPILHDYFQGQSYIFQQDGASLHTAHTVTEFLNDKTYKFLNDRHIHQI